MKQVCSCDQVRVVIVLNMVSRLILIVILVFAVPFSASAQENARESDSKLILLTEQNPPHAYRGGRDGEIKGFSVDIARELMATAGIRYEMALLPWNRAYRRAQTERNVCVFPTNKTPERTPLFQWISPIQKGGGAIFQKADGEIEINSVDDLKNYSLIGKMASVATDLLEEQLDIPIARAADDVAAIQLLYSGRVDLWLSGYVNASALATMNGLPAPKVAFEWKTAEFGIACSLETDSKLILDLVAANTERRAIMAQR